MTESSRIRRLREIVAEQRALEPQDFEDEPPTSPCNVVPPPPMRARLPSVRDLTPEPTPETPHRELSIGQALDVLKATNTPIRLLALLTLCLTLITLTYLYLHH